jgi:cell division transport system permease protein
MDLGSHLAAALAALLALAVLLVIGNTIRLLIENRRDEIIVMKLVGGTDAFVRRPFLYTGIWYGLAGGLIAWLLVEVTLWWLAEPVGRLASLYHSAFQLQRLGLTNALWVIAAAVGLGLAGAWLAVGRHLREIEPT